MGPLLMNLLHNHIFLLLLITLIGIALGRLRIKSFSLGTSGIIFVALFCGHFGFTLPADFQTLGLVLFIYSIGLQAGPGFLSTLKVGGIKLTLGTLTVIGVGFITTLILSLFFEFNDSIAAGLFAGALTSTPGLAVAVEMAGRNGATAAYGLTYFFGVIGVILFIQILPRILKISIPDEEKTLQTELSKNHQPITIQHVELTNPNIFGKEVKDLGLNAIAPVVMTRLLRTGADEPILVGADTVLRAGDHIRLAGRKKDLDAIQLFLGKIIESEIKFERTLINKRLIVSNTTVSGMSLHQLNCPEVFNVQITRITRNGIDLPPRENLRIHLGDTIFAVGDIRALENMAKMLGNDHKEVYSINLLPIFIGILIGFLFGKIPIYIPFGGTFTLGTTGGVLLSGIFLANVYKTGPFIWEIPANANTFIREFGLVLFLATVGTHTGATILDTLSQQGAELFFAGAVVTVLPLIAAVGVCRYVLKLPFLRMLGVMSGSMTSTPGLAASTDISSTSYASSAYATVYPIALIGMILCTKLLVHIL